MFDRRPTIFWLALAATLLGGIVPATAHPHIFANYTVTVTGDDKGIKQLHFLFTLAGVPNPFGSIETYVVGDESRTRQKSVLNDSRFLLAALGENPSFIYLTVNGRTLDPQPVTLQPADGSLAKPLYRFDVTLPQAAHKIVFSLYDPTYYVSVWQIDNNSVHSNPPGITCTTAAFEVGQTAWGPLKAQHVTCSALTPARN